jgi:hypothetical protein
VARKYHDDLKKSDVPAVRNVDRELRCQSLLWADGVPGRFDRRGLQQLWLNILLSPVAHLGSD